MSASPAPEQSASSAASPAPVVAASKKPAPPPKPTNIFSNDGSFLERFKKNNTPTGDQEKEQREKALAQKKALEDRFKKRGKRPAAVDDGAASKKKKDDDSGLTDYQKEVKRLEARSLKSEGYEMRPMLK
ncbi:hypothetical protein JCM1841_004395 [Sporobolomyces salmonicolor]